MNHCWPRCLMPYGITGPQCINTWRSRQDGRHFPVDSFKCIFSNENVWISIKISLKFVLKSPINNIPALMQIMAWRRPGAKPLPELMMVRLTTHIYVTRPQWANLCILIIFSNWMYNLSFWRTVSPFMSDKSSRNGNNIILQEDDQTIVDDKQISEIFNDFFSNIASTIGFDDSITSTTDSILKHKNHPSVVKINGKFADRANTFVFN